ncbi:MAG: SDR family NAD(P)-dependent oxidoreductase [Promethearchaeota archaeon]
MGTINTSLLKGKVTLITGAGQGIGKALALGFAQRGSDIILTARNREKLEDVRILIEEKGVRALVVPADIQKYDEITNVITKGITEFGHIDILINNAGFSRVKPIIKMRVEQFQGILTTNVIGTYNVTHAIIPHMLELGGGRIINTGSAVIEQPGAGWSAYHMSKSALVGFTESLAVELKPKKITVNTIHPGPTDTPLFRMGMTEEMIESIGPMDPAELVPYYAFTASDMAKKVTGQNIMVDLCKTVLGMRGQVPPEETVSWVAVKDIAEQKLSKPDFKKVKKARKLIDYLFTL